MDIAKRIADLSEVEAKNALLYAATREGALLSICRFSEEKSAEEWTSEALDKILKEALS